MPDDELREYHGKLQNESYWVATQLLFRLGPKPAPPRDTPALVLGGEMDRAVSKEDVEQIARCYGISAYFIPGMAHDQMLDPGWRKAAEHIITGFEGTSSLRPRRRRMRKRRFY